MKTSILAARMAMRWRFLFTMGALFVLAGSVSLTAMASPEDNGRLIPALQQRGKPTAVHFYGLSGRTLNLQDDAEPSATKTPRRRATKTPKPYDEMIGIPTLPSEGETAVAAAKTVAAGVTPSVRPTATIAPSLLDDGTLALVVGPEGGTLTLQGVTVNFPAGSLASSSTITIRPVPDGSLPISNGVTPISGSGFEVTVAGADGRAIEKFAGPAEIRVKLDPKMIAEGVRLYRASHSTLDSISNMRIEGDELVVSISAVTRIVVGKPAAVSGPAKRNVLPFIIGAVVVVVAMIIMTLLAGMFRPRRQRIITNRRPTRTRHR